MTEELQEFIEANRDARELKRDASRIHKDNSTENMAMLSHLIV
jgi:hypothetical protein